MPELAAIEQAAAPPSAVILPSIDKRVPADMTVMGQALSFT